MTLNLLVFLKTGHTISLSHEGDMVSFVNSMALAGAIISASGMYVPRDSISHIVPQITPHVPGEALQQVNPEGETKQ